MTIMYCRRGIIPCIDVVVSFYMHIFFSNVLIDINKMHNCNCAWSPSAKAEFI